MQIPLDSTIIVQTKRDRSLLGVEQPRRTALAGRLEQRIGLPDDFRDARNRRHIAFELGRLLRLDQPRRRRRIRAVEPHIEKRFAAPQDQVLLRVVPLERHRKSTAPVRSEEHTSELQSLMRNSYAVFCLKKKKKHKLLIQHNAI